MFHHASFVVLGDSHISLAGFLAAQDVNVTHRMVRLAVLGGAAFARGGRATGRWNVVGLAGFEPAASSSRTIFRFYRRERKITEKNGVYREKCRKVRGNRHLKNGIYPALEPENGKKKPHGGHVRGHVKGIPRPLRSSEFGLGLPPVLDCQNRHRRPEGMAIRARFRRSREFLQNPAFGSEPRSPRSHGDVFRSVFFSHDFMKHNQ